MRSLRGAVFLGIFFVGSVCWACKCPMPGNVAKELALSDAVFQGEVIKLDATQGGSSRHNVHVTFRVDKVWKGKVTAQFLSLNNI